jgi:uncharacterized protein YabE (DUF348 family)
MPLAKNIKRYFSLKEVVIVLLAVVISVMAGFGVYFSLRREVAINDNGKLMLVKTMKTTVKEVLEQNRLIVRPEDYVSLPLDSELQKKTKNEITIKRAVPVNILVDGQTVRLLTYRDTVREALKNSPVALDADDKLSGCSYDDRIAKDMNIRVIRVNENLVSVKDPIPFKVERLENNRMDKGTEKVAREGTEGIREKLFKVVLEDGKEIARELVKDSVVLAPVARVIEFGTILNHKTARGDIIRYDKVLDMKATAYTASYKDTGKHPGDPGFGITYSGIRVKKGVIAVDPKVIPLGTKVYVEVAGSTPDYGYAVAADIGEAIKGNLIDLYFDSQKTVDNWGRKRVKVYIIND